MTSGGNDLSKVIITPWSSLLTVFPCLFILMRKVYRSIAVVFFIAINFSSFGQVGQINISRVDQMPDLPAPYEMRNWKEVARRYDDFIYATDKIGQYLPLVKLKSTSTNYPGLQPILLQTYVGGPTNAAEAINIIPSIVSATLVGKDKSNQNGINWVQKAKDFFNKANQQNIYLNNYSSVSGNDWWYDVMPNVFFYQMYSQYPSDTDFQSQFVTVADRWLDAVYHMGGSSTPWSAPDMNYRGWRLASMTGNSDGVLEPESAGSIAWILYNAYIRTGEKKYLDGAHMCTEFLSSLNSNPSYELQLPYGTLTAARMNAEQGTGYDINKMLNWSFDRGELRGWGTIVGKWDGKDVSGLIGEANDSGNDYAFAMNGYQQAAALVPLIKYDKRYARAIAKWTLNLANASRFYYSQYLASDRQDDYVWSSTNDPESVIGYEALKEHNVYASNLPLYGTGDAKRNGWASTNLGLYGSSHVGYLGAIVETTDVEGILKLDVNKTDFYGQNAYPTFAFYNPYSTQKQVTLALGSDTYDIYDAISETIIQSSVTGNQSVSIPANEALLLSYLPAGSTPVEEKGKLVIGSNVVDFHYGYDFTPAIRVKSMAATDKNFAFAETATVYASVDNASAAVTYEWYVNDVLTSTTPTGVFNWTTPSVEGDYTIKLKASSGGDDAIESIVLSVWQVVPAPPNITGLSPDQKMFYEDEQVPLIAAVESAGTEKLSYEWNITGGTFTSNDSLLAWTAPLEGIYKISVTVTNHLDLQSTYTRDVLVKKRQEGTTDALAYFPFDGDVNDYAGNNDAQSANVDPAPDQRGNPNSAYLFDSGADIIFIPNKLTLNFVDAVTLSFWIKATTVAEESFIISHGSWEERYKISIIPNGKLRWTVKTSEGVVDLDSSDPLVLNQYHHVTVVYSGYSLEMYLDGELDVFAAHSGSLLQTTKSITFGRKDEVETRYFLSGILDEVRIYNEELSPEEIATLKTLWNTPMVTGLEAARSLQPYPNPARQGRFTIDTNRSDVVSLALTDLSGRRIDFSTVDHAGRIEIHPAGEFRGMMILKVTTTDKISVFKIIAD